MRQVWILAAALALAATLGAASAGAAPAAVRAIPPEALEPFVDGVVAEGMAATHVAGVTVSIVQNGKVVLVKGYGVARPGEPVDPKRDLFRIGSISKTFTWIVLMREVEAGRIRLDAPVNDYLPSDLKIPDQGFGRPIRVIDLMSHAAGFEALDRTYLIIEQGGRVVPLAEDLRLHRPRRVREPGVLASYSNYGAALAGYIAARSAGESFQDLIDREVTGPLGMTSTTFREPYPRRADLPEPMAPDLARRVAVGFTWKDGGYQQGPFEFISQGGPAGAASTTAPDMARYMLMALGGGALEGRRIYSAETAQAFRTPILKTPAGVNGWAHGLMIRTLPGGYLSFGHGGSLDRFFSNMSLVPDLNLGVFISTNTSTGRALAESLPKRIVERFYAPAEAGLRRPGDPALAKQAGLYAGRYVTTRRAYSGLGKFADLLESHDRVWVDRSGYLFTKLGEEIHAWVPDGPPGHFIDADGAAKLVFSLDRKGRATGFPFWRGTYTAERAGPLLGEGVLSASAVLGLAAAVAIWICALPWFRTSVTRWQRRVGLLGLAVASLWLMAFALYWRSGLLSGEAPSTDDFPGPFLVASSWAAVMASAGSLTLLGALLPALGRSGDEPGWGAWRKIAQGAIVTAFLVLALLIGIRGGLEPWA